MSIAQKIRGLFGQQLLQNTAGFKVIRASCKTGPWVNEGEQLSLIPAGIQEVQFPVEVMGSDSIAARVQTSVVFTYVDGAENFFNFAYDVRESKHTGNYSETAKKVIMNALVPKVMATSGGKTISDLVKETTLMLENTTAPCEGISIKSVQLSVGPKDANVMAALGAQKTEDLVRSANDARHLTRKQAVNLVAELRTAEHNEAMEAEREAKRLIAEKAENALAEAKSAAAAQAELSAQKAVDAQAMVKAFNNDPAAYALCELARSGGNITVTTEFLSAFRGKV